MNQEINKILSDLYEADPGLKKREKEILEMIQELVVSRPDTKFDDSFRAQLREEIMRRAADLDAKPKVVSPGAWLIWVQRIGFAVAGAAICLLVIFPNVYKQAGTNSLTALKNVISHQNSGQVEKLGDKAFGNLLLSTAQTGVVSESTSQTRTSAGTDLSAPVSNASPAYDLGVKTQSATAPAAIGMGGGVSGKAIAVSPGMPIYWGGNFKYAYKGEAISVLKDKMDIYKHVAGSMSPDALSVLNSANLGAIDWSKYSGANIQDMNLLTAGDKNYYVSINFKDGTVSISQNWNAWTTVSSNMAVRCLTPDCGSGVQPLKIEDLPPNDKVIEAANNFVRTMGISLTGYGAPFVQDDWRANYDATPDKINYYIPEQLTVIYPQNINSQDIYDQSGNKTGISVTVNVRDLSATGAWNIQTQNYQSSAYDVETDTQRLIKIAEGGGFGQKLYTDPNAPELQTVELGTPSLEYAKIWIYKDNTSQELIMPVYVFPITKKPQGIYLYQNNVIVPLIKEVLDQQDQQPVPVPYMMKGGTGVMTPASEPASVPGSAGEAAVPADK